MAIQISKETVENLNVKECLFEGLDIFKGNILNVFIAFLFMAVGSLITIGILAGSLYAGFVDYVLKLKNKDETAKPADVFSKLNILVPALLVGLVILGLNWANGFIIGGIFGGVISFLTGILISSVTMSFATISIPLLSNGKITSPVEALQTGWNTFLLSPKTFLILAILVNALSFIGILLLGIGILVTAPIASCMMAVASEKLTKEA